MTYGAFTFVAVSKGQIIGFVSFDVIDRTGLGGFVVIHTLCTSPQYQRRGIAIALLNFTEQWAIQHHHCYVLLETASTTRQFYLHRGFEPSNEFIKALLKYQREGFRKDTHPHIILTDLGYANFRGNLLYKQLCEVAFNE